MKLLIVGLLALSVVSAKTLNIVQPMPCAFICWRKDQACKDACAPCEDCQKGGMPPHEHPVPYSAVVLDEQECASRSDVGDMNAGLRDDAEGNGQV
ncbi:hypothetical protein V8E36_006442 [Tilletia maclaganii]